MRHKPQWDSSSARRHEIWSLVALVVPIGCLIFSRKSWSSFWGFSGSNSLEQSATRLDARRKQKERREAESEWWNAQSNSKTNSITSKTADKQTCAIHIMSYNGWGTRPNLMETNLWQPASRFDWISLDPADSEDAIWSTRYVPVASLVSDSENSTS